MTRAGSAPRRRDLVISAQGWARWRGRRFGCALGRNGVTRVKREGDGATLAGVFAWEWGYWRADRLARPRTVLPMAALRRDLGWSDDAADARYNQPVRLPHAFGHERLWRADGLYNLVVVIDANRAPIAPGAGSALFLHCWRGARRPTEGCVAFAPHMLRRLIEGWAPGDRVFVRD